MNIQELYETYIGMWPCNVRIDDAHLTGAGPMFPMLSQAHASIENGLDHEADPWGSIFTWSMFQACHRYARELIEQGNSTLNTSDVPLELIDEYITTNLADESWADERSQYSTSKSRNLARASSSSTLLRSKP